MPDFSTTNVAATAGQNAPNALQTLQGIAQLRNTINQNKLFPLQQQQLQLQNQTTQQELQAKKIGMLQGALAATKDPSEVSSVVSRFVRAGLIDSDTAANVLGGNVESLSAQSLDTLRRQSIMAAGDTAEVGAMTGTPTPVQTGAGTKFENVNPFTDQVAPMQGEGAFVPNALSPQDLATKVETADADGTKHLGVMGDYVNSDSSWKAGVPHPMTALGPLSQATQATLGAAYGPQIATFEQQAAGAPNQRNLIENMRAEAAQFDSGPQSDAWKRFGQLAHEYGVPVPAFAADDQTANREAFGKTATMILGGQQAALHMDQTDASRQTAEAASPNASLTPQGRAKVLAIIEGNADMMDAAGKAWAAQKAKGGPASWGQFQMEFPNRVPPSIFQAQYLKPDELAAMQKGWSATKKADWQKRYDRAKALGWLPNAE